MKEFKLEIKIKEINVMEDFYEVHFKYRINGKKWNNDMLDGDYDNGLSEREWRVVLESGVAMESVLQKIADETELEKPK